MLDLRRPDAIARTGDHVVLAADVPEVAVGILPAEIAGEQEFTGIFFRRRFRNAPVLAHGARARVAHADHAAFAPRHLLAALIEDADVASRRRPSQRSRTDLK